MAEQIGIVLLNEMNGWARVVTDRKGACGDCQSGPSACRSCLSSAKLESRVTNPIDAKNGDVVKISLPSANLFKGAAILYLLPVATLILGAITGMWLGTQLGWNESTGAVLGSLAGIGTGFGLVAGMGRSRKLSRQMTPAITSIVTAADSAVSQPNNGR